MILIPSGWHKGGGIWNIKNSREEISQLPAQECQDIPIAKLSYQLDKNETDSLKKISVGQTNDGLFSIRRHKLLEIHLQSQLKLIYNL